MHSSGTRRTSAPQRIALVVTALVAVAVPACGSDDPGSDGAAPDSGRGDTVTLVTYDSFALPEGAAEAFEERTGATIEVVASGDSGAMLAGALLTAGSPDGDVIFGIDNTSATEVDSAPLLEDYTPDAASALPDDLAAPGGLADQLTAVDTSEVCINVDEEWFSTRGLQPPSGLDDLVDPAYRDLLVVESPVNSSPGLAFLLGTITEKGEDGFEAYWRALDDNGVKVAPSWDDAYYNDYTVSGGDRPLVVSYASSPPAEVVFSEGERTEPASSVMEASCVTQVEYAGLLAGAPNPELGRELIDFMLDPQWQGALPLANFVYPVTDVELPEEFAMWAPRPADPIAVDAERVGESRDEWIEQWRSVME